MNRGPRPENGAHQRMRAENQYAINFTRIRDNSLTFAYNLLATG